MAFLAACTIAAYKQNQTDETKPVSTWELVWEDKFDVPGLPNLSICGYETGYFRNYETQNYTTTRPENVRVEDGYLVIKARKDKLFVPFSVHFKMLVSFDLYYQISGINRCLVFCA
jgi:hypothetical protein